MLSATERAARSVDAADRLANTTANYADPGGSEAVAVQYAKLSMKYAIDALVVDVPAVFW